jgi:hypothetical protein
MKKTSIFLVVFFLISCNKEKHNVEITKNEVKIISTIDSNGVKKTDSVAVFNKTLNGKTTKAENRIEKYEYTYQAFDGSQALVTFVYEPNKSYIVIERNNHKIELPKTQANNKLAVFEKEDIKAIAEGNKLTIHQKDNIFELERKK